MKFETPAGPNPIDRMKVVGRATLRVDGPLKVTGTAPYAYERHDVVAGIAYGHMVGSAIAKGKILRIDTADADAAPGVIGIITTLEVPKPVRSSFNAASLFGGPIIQHYHQAVAIVVAETFEQARAAAALVRVHYDRAPGVFDLAQAASRATMATEQDKPLANSVGDFAGAFAAAPVKIDQTYSTPDESHAMMEPHATIASWEGDKLTLWTSSQIITRNKGEMVEALGLKPENVRFDSPYIGGGFGAKLFLRSDAVLTALAARKLGRPVKLALARPQIANNTTHRPATIQRVRLAAGRDGHLTAIAHESTSGNLQDGKPEKAVAQSHHLYAGANREMATHITRLDLPEGNAMRAPGEGAGLMVLEMAMDEMAEALAMDPVEFRIRNDTQVDPEKPDRPYSQRHMVECLRKGAAHFGWSKRSSEPAKVREGRDLIGMGVAVGFRNNLVRTSGARLRLEGNGRLTVESDMTDIGTGSYTVLAQTAAEMMGLSIDQITVRLGDSNFPAAAGSGGQYGANSATSGVYAACVKLRETVAQKLGFNTGDVTFADGKVTSGNRSISLGEAAHDGTLVVEDRIEFGDLGRKYILATFVAHFVEVAVDALTGETRVRRMLAVCDSGRILNPVTARSQVIGGMTMGVGAALMEELAVDKRFGFFVNHDLASYEVPVHADIPHQEVIFLDGLDDKSSPMKAKGVGELGLCGVGAAIANAVYNATGVRVRDYPITLDKYLEKLPKIA